MSELAKMDVVDVYCLLVCHCVHDYLIAGIDPKLLQDYFDILMEIFDQVGLQTNLTKTEVDLPPGNK